MWPQIQHHRVELDERFRLVIKWLTSDQLFMIFLSLASEISQLVSLSRLLWRKVGTQTNSTFKTNKNILMSVSVRSHSQILKSVCNFKPFFSELVSLSIESIDLHLLSINQLHWRHESIVCIPVLGLCSYPTEMKLLSSSPSERLLIKTGERAQCRNAQGFKHLLWSEAPICAHLRELNDALRIVKLQRNSDSRWCQDQHFPFLKFFSYSREDQLGFRKSTHLLASYCTIRTEWVRAKCCCSGDDF